jgi:beta-barrel assembly-enhancing protease
MSMPSSATPLGQISGRFSDGKSAASHDAIIAFTPAGLALTIDGQPGPVWAYGDLKAATPVAASSHNILLSPKADPDATLFVSDVGFCGPLLKHAPHLSVAAERWRVLKPGLAVGATALSIAIAAWALDFSPTKGIASLIPNKARTALGSAVVDGMVGTRRICRDPAGIIALDKLHARLLPTAVTGKDRIIVVDWNLVNAFAVPGGQVVVTRAIIDKASSADEVAGVIGHELGHGLALHPETGLVRGLGFWAVLQFFATGSPGMLSDIGATAMQFSYTRAAEREADQYAVRLLRESGVSSKPFAGFFKKLDPDGQIEKAPTPSGRFGGIKDIFSTHPDPAERMATIQALPDYPATPALSDADWKALQGICGPKKKPDAPAAAKPTGPTNGDGTPKSATDKSATDKSATPSPQVKAKP